MARLAFLGTPAAAVPTLRALVAAGHEVTTVVTRPDRRRGRGGTTSPSPVKAAALELGLRVTDRLSDLPDGSAELGVVVAFGRLLRPELLEQLPMINVHFSLLPRWRGAAPVERAILAGDSRTGVCVMHIAAELDAGDILDCRATAIGADDTLSSLTDRLAHLGAEAVVELLAGGVTALPAARPQTGEATYAEKLQPEELELQWRRSAEELVRVVRLERAWTTFRGHRLRVLCARSVSGPESGSAVSPEEVDGVGGTAPGTLLPGGVVTGRGTLQPLEVQPEGRRPTSWEDWWRGARPRPGERFGVAGQDEP